jgi:hypothetical protein
MVETGHRPVLHLRLGHGGPEVHVPHRGRLAVVRVSLGIQVQEARLGDAPARLVDGGVHLPPVDGQPRPPPQVAERLFVPLRHLAAQLDEVLPRDAEGVLFPPGGVGLREGKRGIVGEPRIAAHVEVVLHPPLGGQAVVVPSHGVIDVLPAHALRAYDDVRVGIAEDVAYVQRPGNGGRGGVDHEGVVPGPRGIVAVRSFLLPRVGKPFLHALGVEMVGKRFRIDARERRCHPGLLDAVRRGAMIMHWAPRS